MQRNEFMKTTAGIGLIGLGVGTLGFGALQEGFGKTGIAWGQDNPATILTYLEHHKEADALILAGILLLLGGWKVTRMKVNANSRQQSGSYSTSISARRLSSSNCFGL